MLECRQAVKHTTAKFLKSNNPVLANATKTKVENAAKVCQTQAITIE